MQEWGVLLCPPLCSSVLARPLSPGATLLLEAPTPQCPTAQGMPSGRDMLLLAGGHLQHRGGKGTGAAHRAHRGGTMAPVAFLGRGLVTRQQIVLHRYQVSARFTALSSQVSVQPVGKAASQAETGRAAFEARWGEKRQQHRTPDQHLRPASMATRLPAPVAAAAPAACTSSQPPWWLFWGRKAPGSSSPTWQTVTENVSGMSLPAPAL